MSDVNGKELPEAETRTDEAPEPGSPEHVLGVISHQLGLLLNNDRIIGQALAMLLSGAAHQHLVREEVIAMIRRLDPEAKFEQPSPILRPVGKVPPHRLS